MVRFVDTTQSDFNLTNWSHICKEHFIEDCVDESVGTKARLGIKCPFRLKPGAVPTLKAPTAASSTSRPAPGTDGGQGGRGHVTTDTVRTSRNDQEVLSGKGRRQE